MRYVFSEVKVPGEKSGPCIHCGKRRTRRTTETATENPWNVGDNGLPRTRSEIDEVLRGRIREWKKLPIICKTCANETLWTVGFRAGDWTTHQCRDHSRIGEVLWESRHDSGHCIVYAQSEDEAMSLGVATLKKAMQSEVRK